MTTTAQADALWTDCPYCGTVKSVEPFFAVPAQVWNSGASDEFEAYGDHERAMCYDCDAIVTR